MTAQVFDLVAKKADRDAKAEERAAFMRPYASMDDLPDVTPAGQRVVWDLIFPHLGPRNCS